jgi:hypothetical protein
MSSRPVIKILVTGDREWKDVKRIDELMNVIGSFASATDTEIVIIHGNANGADKLCGISAEERGFTVIPVPAQWEKYGRAAGPIRNAKMLDMLMHGVTPERVLCLAFHPNLTKSKGTKDMVTRALKVGVTVFLTEWSRHVIFTKKGLQTEGPRKVLALLESIRAQQIPLREASEVHEGSGENGGTKVP